MLRLVDGGDGAQDHRGDRDDDDDLLPLADERAEGTDQHAGEQRDRRDLGRRREEGGDRRRRAFIDVRRPHVERHGGDLEGQAGAEEHDADDEAERLRRRRAPSPGPVKLVEPVKP